jgi:carbonic anhydrase/acetyltransferase-like protein (isoleucine patch superfamily)
VSRSGPFLLKGVALFVPYREKWPQIDRSAFVAPTAVVIGDVVIGPQTSLWFNVVVRGDVNFIRIGERTNIQDGCIVHVTKGTFPTHIGNDVTVGHNVTIHGCTVGDRCLIGMGAVLLDGAEIGQDSMVAAGSVVAPGTIIPPGSLALGSPARFKRALTEGEIRNLRISAENYIGYMQEYSIAESDE